MVKAHKSVTSRPRRPAGNYVFYGVREFGMCGDHERPRRCTAA